MPKRLIGRDKASVINYHRDLQRSFDQSYQSRKDFWSQDFTTPVAFSNVIDLLLKLDGPTVLDIGAGKGFGDIIVSSLCKRIDLIDISNHADLLKLPTLSEKLHSQIVNFFNFKQDNGFYDLIIDHGCFHHQHPDRYKKYLAKVSRLMKKGGYLSLLVFENRFGHYEDATLDQSRFCKEFTLDEISGLLNEHGICILDALRIPRGEKVPVIQLIARR